MNLVEKLVARFVVRQGRNATKVRAGDFVSVRPSHVMTHDNTSPVMSKFLSMGGSHARIINPRQPVFALDHNVQDKSAKNLEKYSQIQAFAAQHGIDFYAAGRGIGHQVMVEEGYAFPGSLVVASDSHSNMYGGVGCLGTPVVRTDAASIWATTQTWWQVPPVANVILDGELSPGVTGKDVIIALCGHFCHDDVLNYAVEFTGDGVASLSIDERLTIANMTTEWGALAGVFPIDSVTLDWLKARAQFLATRGPSGVPSDPKISSTSTYKHPRVNAHTIDALASETPRADGNARYAKTLRLDLRTVTPHISGPNHVKTMSSLASLASQPPIKINKAYIVSCVNSRVGDLAEAAQVLKGKKVAEGVKLYVAPASSEVHATSTARGDWQALLDAGAIELPAGCGPCIGLGTGLLEDGEIGISATNRNFKGRMGSINAQAYLASPAVVAASAVAGHITAPYPIKDVQLKASDETSKTTPSSSSSSSSTSTSQIPLVPGFPTTLKGGLIFCNADNINTDGIYPGKYTYRDDIPPQEMGRVAMENFDPAFNTIARSGDILVAGYNFGTGSSREQAATALKYKGIPVVLAGSYSTTYTRNAYNNGFLVLEAPALVDHLRSQSPSSTSLTQRITDDAVIDFTQWQITVNGQTFPIVGVGSAAQELVLADGLEPWVKKTIAANAAARS